MIKAMVETPQEESEFVKWQFEDIESRINANVNKMRQRGVLGEGEVGEGGEGEVGEGGEEGGGGGGG